MTTSEKKLLWSVVALVSVCALIFGQTLTFEFVNLDDSRHVVDNPFINNPSWINLKKLWESQYFQLYSPVIYSFWALVASISQFITGKSGIAGLNPAVFHGFNVLLHTTNAILVFFVIRYLFRKKNPEIPAEGPALLGALLFAVHPLQVEPVAWMSGAKDLLSTALGLGGLWFYFLAVDQILIRSHKVKRSQKINRSTQFRTKSLTQRAAVFYGLSLLLLALGLLAKPSVVVFPGLAFVISYFFLKRPLKVSLWGLPILLLVTLPLVLITQSVQSMDESWYVAPFYLRPLVALDAVYFYLKSLLFPWPLSPDHGRSPENLVKSGMHLFTFLLPLSIAAFCWWKRLTQPIALAAFTFIVVALSPVLGVIPFLHQEISTVADRYFYIPMIGVAIGLAFLVSRSQKKLVLFLTTAIIIAFALVSILQASIWKNTESLFLHVTKVNSQSWLGNYSLAQYYLTTNQMEKGVDHLKKTMKIEPRYHKSDVALGTVYIMKRQYQNAAGVFEDLLDRVKPPEDTNKAMHAEIFFKYAVSQEALGNNVKAAEFYQKSVDANWTDFNAQFEYGRFLLKQSQPEKAYKHLKTAVRLHPHEPRFAQLLKQAEALKQRQPAKTFN